MTSITIEGDQLVLRYPQLPEGVVARELRSPDERFRAGKNAYWMRVDVSTDEWQSVLVEFLGKIAKE